MELMAGVTDEELMNLHLLVLDVDGVLTDGTICYSDGGYEIKNFHAADGAGLKYWHRVGHQSAIISGRASPAISRRAEELGISSVRMGVKDKLPALQELLVELKVKPENAVYVGDDLPDIPAMRHVRLALTVPNAVDEVKDFAAGVTQRAGGKGAVREVIELILKAQGRWELILARYFPELKL